MFTIPRWLSLLTLCTTSTLAWAGPKVASPKKLEADVVGGLELSTLTWGSLRQIEAGGRLEPVRTHEGELCSSVQLWVRSGGPKLNRMIFFFESAAVRELGDAARPEAMHVLNWFNEDPGLPYRPVEPVAILREVDGYGEPADHDWAHLYTTSRPDLYLTRLPRHEQPRGVVRDLGKEGICLYDLRSFGELAEELALAAEHGLVDRIWSVIDVIDQAGLDRTSYGPELEAADRALRQHLDDLRETSASGVPEAYVELLDETARWLEHFDAETHAAALDRLRSAARPFSEEEARARYGGKADAALRWQEATDADRIEALRALSGSFLEELSEGEAEVARLAQADALGRELVARRLEAIEARAEDDPLTLAAAYAEARERLAHETTRPLVRSVESHVAAALHERLLSRLSEYRVDPARMPATAAGLRLLEVGLRSASWPPEGPLSDVDALLAPVVEEVAIRPSLRTPDDLTSSENGDLNSILGERSGVGLLFGTSWDAGASADPVQVTVSPIRDEALEREVADGKLDWRYRSVRRHPTDEWLAWKHERQRLAAQTGAANEALGIMQSNAMTAEEAKCTPRAGGLVQHDRRVLKSPAQRGQPPKTAGERAVAQIEGTVYTHETSWEFVPEVTCVNGYSPNAIEEQGAKVARAEAALRAFDQRSEPRRFHYEESFETIPSEVRRQLWSGGFVRELTFTLAGEAPLTVEQVYSVDGRQGLILRADTTDKTEDRRIPRETLLDEARTQLHAQVGPAIADQLTHLVDARIERSLDARRLRGPQRETERAWLAVLFGGTSVHAAAIQAITAGPPPEPEPFTWYAEGPASENGRTLPSRHLVQDVAFLEESGLVYGVLKDAQPEKRRWDDFLSAWMADTGGWVLDDALLEGLNNWWRKEGAEPLLAIRPAAEPHQLLVITQKRGLLYDTLSARPLHYWRWYPKDVAAISPDGRRVFIAEYRPEGTQALILTYEMNPTPPRIWYPSEHREVVLEGGAILDDRVRKVGFSDEGGAVLYLEEGGDDLFVWDLDTHRRVPGFETENRLVDAAFSEDGALVTGLMSDGSIEAWSTATGKAVAAYRATTPFSDGETDTGRLIALEGGWLARVGKTTADVHLVSRDGSLTPLPLAASQKRIGAVERSADGTALHAYVYTYDGDDELITVAPGSAAGASLRRIAATSTTPSDAMLLRPSPDGAYIAVVSDAALSLYPIARD